MRILVLIILFFSSVSGIILSQSNKTINEFNPAEKFDPERNPEKDLQAAVVEAVKSDKKILLDVGGEWCIWCHILDSLYSQNKNLLNYLNENYIVTKVNFSPENRNEKFLSQFPEIEGYPHYFVLDKNGRMIHSQNTADLEDGKGYSVEKVLTFLKKWAEK